MAGNLERCESEAVKRDFRPQMKILNMIIPILMHFCGFVAQTGALDATELITSNYFRQFITGYTVANF